MNQGTLEGIKKTFVETASVAAQLLRELEEITKREEAIALRERQYQVKITDLVSREGKMREEKLDIERQKREISMMLDVADTRKAEVIELEKRIDAKRQSFKDEEVDIALKKQELSDLQAENARLQSLEHALNVRKDGLDHEEAMIQKERILDRERKAALDRKEEQLNRDIARIKQLQS